MATVELKKKKYKKIYFQTISYLIIDGVVHI